MGKTINPTVKMEFYDALALGELPNAYSIGKWGHAPSGVQTTETDIWDRADATPTQQTWTAPTQARIHNIASTSGLDIAITGTGLRTLQVYGLTDWDTPETSEVVSMDGTNNVATANSYVIIHRMKALTWGTAGPNVGTITATAATDTTITAVVLAGIGQTRMAIYGIASGQELAINHYYGSMFRSSGTASGVDLFLKVNPIPASQLAGFVTKHELGISKDGGSYASHTLKPSLVVTGPAIIKMSAIASAADIDTMAGFGGMVRNII